MERRQASNLGCRLGVGRGKECCGFRRNFSYSLSGECCVVFNRSIIILREPGRDEEQTAGEGRILRRPPHPHSSSHTPVRRVSSLRALFVLTRRLVCWNLNPRVQDTQDRVTVTELWNLR